MKIFDLAAASEKSEERIYGVRYVFLEKQMQQTFKIIIFYFKTKILGRINPKPSLATLLILLFVTNYLTDG